MTSFCRSTNILLRGSGRPEGTSHMVRAGDSSGSSSCGGSGSSAGNPAAATASRPARAPCSRQARSENAPLHAPAERSGWRDSPGRNMARASS